MQSKQYFTKIKNYPHEKSTEPTSASVERIIRMYPVNRYTLCFSNKKEERANGYIAHKALSRGKYLSCIPKHTTQDGIQSSLSAPRAPESG